MKKRMTALLALVLLLFAALAAAQPMAVVNPGKWDDRLNLRAKPDKSASSLGKYYTGTRVSVIEDLGAWKLVRIASGVSGSRVSGYMMSEYLREIEGTYSSSVSLMPLGTLEDAQQLLDENGVPLHRGSLPAGEAVYVMGVSGKRVHVLTQDGKMGYLPAGALTGAEDMPREAQRLLRENIGVASGGAQLIADGKVVATLHGGVRLEDAWLMQGRENALAFLGDIGGMLPAGTWTWWDNGANCGCEYPVYVQHGQLAEVLGETADGRLIVRRAGTQTSLEEASALEGAMLIENPQNLPTLYYSEPLIDEITDETAIANATAALGRLPDGLSVRVRRCVQPQWGFRMLFVDFLYADGKAMQSVELDPLTGDVLAHCDNG